MNNFIVAILLACLMPLAAAAQRLVGSAPRQVAVGEQFRLTYTINTQNVSGFRAGNIPDALEVLMGPSTSSQSSFQMVNGHTSSSSSITYTYIVSASRKGSFTIPPAHINVGGHTVASNALTVHVSGSAARQQGGGGGGEGEQMRPAGSHISGSDLFIKVSANKKRVHEQEPVLLTYKVYTLVDLTQLNGKMPDLKGFHTQEVPLPQQKSFKLERVNGRPYRTVTWSQYVMFPQVTGKLEIPGIAFDGVVVLQNRSVDPFEAFFNGGSGYVEVKKRIQAPGLTIQVDPLPERPANFSGGVGRFTLSAQLNKNSIKANNPVNIRIIVSGIGNLKLVKQPQVNVPKDFDKYDAKITDQTKLTSNGVEGNMIFDVMVVPRHQGRFEIPPVELNYYDTGENAYKTLRTQPMTLNVEKGDGSSSVDDYTGSGADELNKDIRYIKTGDAPLHDVDDFFFGSTAYWLCLILLLAGFISLFVIFRQRAIENADIVKMRGKKASKVATRRLRKASQLMLAGRTGEFYDEVLRALWGYVGDKLNISVEKLSRENISERLSEHGVDESVTARFIEALDECEFERYAPGDEKGNMNKTFEAAMTAIMQIEETMKQGRRKAATGAATAVTLLLMLLTPAAAGAVSKTEADSAYARQQYQLAVKDYEQLLRKGVSADIYYNLGNAYYRSGNITRAVLNYERAAMLSPGDADIRYNLQLARSKTVDKITPASEMFFVTWYRSIVNLMSVDAWARTALWSMALAVVLALVYLFAQRVWQRKGGFFGSAAFVVVFLLSNLFAWQQRRSFENRSGAIVTAISATVKSTPAASGTDLFVIHEGTKVDITDDSMAGWKKISLDDGRQGWIQTSGIEKI